jgi:hypothetical protein
MDYNLKDKIKVTDEFLAELIAKSWREAEALQQQVTNIDTSTVIGAEVVKALQNTCTNYYVFAGCLESIADKLNDDVFSITDSDTSVDNSENNTKLSEPETVQDESIDIISTDNANNFEPFEYFVDFDEPLGNPISDQDLYGN